MQKQTVIFEENPKWRIYKDSTAQKQHKTNTAQCNASTAQKQRSATQHSTKTAPHITTGQHNTTQHNTTQHNTTQHNKTSFHLMHINQFNKCKTKNLTIKVKNVDSVKKHRLDSMKSKHQLSNIKITLQYVLTILRAKILLREHNFLTIIYFLIKS